MRKNYLLLCFVAISLVACGPKKIDLCRVSNWQAIGYQHGLTGKPASYNSAAVSGCNGRVDADQMDRYHEGRSNGLKRYCTVRFALEAGKAGEPNFGVCRHRTRAAEISAAHDLGLEIHALRKLLDQKAGQPKPGDATVHCHSTRNPNAHSAYSPSVCWKTLAGDADEAGADVQVRGRMRRLLEDLEAYAASLVKAEFRE